jgi:hypothetical protein
VGRFNKSLPQSAVTYRKSVAFMDVDYDSYSSAKCMFDVLSAPVTAGTVIHFGKYCNYPGWEQHADKAFQEFLVQEPGIPLP